MDPRDFLTLADRLSAGTTAAEHRTAIGRSYYALFNVAADTLRQLGFHVRRSASAHGEVQLCLHNSGDPEVQAVASELGDLHSWRNRADYQLGKSDVEEAFNAATLVRIARGSIRSLDAAFSGPERIQLQATISQWRRANGYP